MLIGHARSSETKSKNGVAGDQTGHEVSITEWYDAGWQHVLRPINNRDAENIAAAVEQACGNDHIGYSQADRYSLYNEYMNSKTIAGINKDVNCDCSSLVTVALLYAGIVIPSGMSTSDEVEHLRNTGKFHIITDPEYLKSPKLLKRGDILHKLGHTATCLTYGSASYKISSSVICMYKDYTLQGLYKTVTACNMRYDSNIRSEIMTVVPKDKKVSFYGYYNIDERGVKWYYVQYIGYFLFEGFISEKCLERII